MASEKQVEASRINGAKSKGPKTEAGKARSAANATTHGLTAQPEAVAADGSDAYLEWLRNWIADRKPSGVVELALVERACRAAWRLDRLARHEDAVTSCRARTAADRHDCGEAARADWLGRRLVATPAPHRGVRLTPVTEGDDPASLLAEMESTAAGAAWLLRQWAELGRVMDAYGYWDNARKVAAVRMLGLRPEDVLDDPAVGAIFVANYVLAPAPHFLWTHCYEVAAINPHIPDERERVAQMEEHLPDEAGATRALETIVRRETARLKRRKADILDARAAADREGAIDRSLLGDAPGAAALLLRYEAASSRDLIRSLGELSKLRKEASREKTESGREEAPPPKRRSSPDPSGSRPPPPPPSLASSSPTARPSGSILPNEPGATESGGREGSAETCGKVVSGQPLGRFAPVCDPSSPRPSATRIACRDGTLDGDLAG